MMRPDLNNKTDYDIFMDYYWLKEELLRFCKEYGLPGSGKKEEITYRIYHFLKTGEVLKVQNNSSVRKNAENQQICLSNPIPHDYKNDTRHRNFFKSVIGNHFSFNLPFMEWMKENTGRTYQEAIDQWIRIYNEKKTGKKYEIDSQFEYNQYTRDFFAANQKADRAAAIKCWKYKKSLPGHNRYEDSDLIILKE
jgi:hypothetical protein